MGRHCGDLTISAALASGCEYIIVPEKGLDKESLMRNIEDGFSKGKRHAIIAITELMTDVQALAKEIEDRFGHETRATVLGHIQRGGAPCPFDRILASRMGVYAVDLLLQGYGGRCVGIKMKIWYTMILLMRSTICVVRSKKNCLKRLENYFNFP